jgi:hypothetical protein
VGRLVDRVHHLIKGQAEGVAAWPPYGAVEPLAVLVGLCTCLGVLGAFWVAYGAWKWLRRDHEEVKRGRPR